MRILGIDPGTTAVGFAVLDEVNGALTAITYGTTDLRSKDLGEKLYALQTLLDSLVVTHRPDAANVEKLFFSKNKKTAIDVSHARGVIIATLYKHGVQTFELTPGQVKMAVTNYGNADKQMVATMVARLLKLPQIDGDDNAADALAIAIAGASMLRTDRSLKNSR